ncbi:hypothetical protein [Francisella adeliensis]|uniref:Uncharacterized protein n=1 Tax=Francisella adeliensis TaxID=2007306 RepID=A0A2Z4Y0K3_9GAMM|nr:hypothetical protein [Francisella adeliensis]AXA34600.1 hypothetical protein CDH04_09420 [Francisella adeliensis]MBK2086325.1 hypothetical protein [Francisella adeliensis]MBK2096540.1 hypothetical protein [Francisella adeliensis]QIW12844.1 hypothetical protein FZC43_09430 [Francisella adeliensis]QIW14721.1 hypothetical protein FZC44_09420 [Francisella adeliensis]
MTNYIVAFVIATIIYLIAIRYLQQLCPMSKFFKFIIYICISTVALPAVNYLHPPANGEDDIVTSLMSKFSSTENEISGDWQSAQQQANSLIHGSSSQDSSETNNSSGIRTTTFADERSVDDQSQDIIIGRNGKELD